MPIAIGTAKMAMAATARELPHLQGLWAAVTLAPLVADGLLDLVSNAGQSGTHDRLCPHICQSARHVPQGREGCSRQRQHN